MYHITGIFGNKGVGGVNIKMGGLLRVFFSEKDLGLSQRLREILWVPVRVLACVVTMMQHVHVSVSTILFSGFWPIYKW